MARAEQESASDQSRNAEHTSSRGTNGAAEGGRGVSAIDLLKADHRKVEELFESYQNAKRRQQKSKIASDICRELIIHSEIEEEIFYPACREHVEDEMLDEAQVEHDSAKILIGEIAVGMPSNEFFDAKVKVLGEYIRHHIEEEEKRNDSIFAQAEEGGLDMMELGQQMQARKDELIKEMRDTLVLPQPVSLDVIIGEEDEFEEETRRGRDKSGGRQTQARGAAGRGRGGEAQEDRWGRGGGRMPERDEYGRFMSEEDESQSSRGGRGEREEDDRRRGGEERDRSASRGPERGDDDDKWASRSSRGEQGRGGHGGWFGDPEGHSQAARRGREHRR